MRRADRLLQIIQVLRRRRTPTTAERIAEELEVSVRTVYRDMAALLASGVPVAGEAGIGYVLRAGYDLPPLMFTIEEIEALVLGAQMVARAGDAALAKAARDSLAKVEHVLPRDLHDALTRTALFAPNFGQSPAPAVDLGVARSAIRRARKLQISYRDEKGAPTRRTVWPLALAYFTDTTLLCAWCELRRDFRHFRADRIETMAPLEARYDTRGGRLVRDYLARVGAPTRNPPPSRVSQDRRTRPVSASSRRWRPRMRRAFRD
ncbi:MAG: YafY family transcriptional regulator [Rhodospirillales bacterium]|nr:YafY family transcriptional regulator [Rhodospirillales bacterium]